MKIWLSCEETGRLTSEALDRRLTRRERLGVVAHRFVCRHCTELARDLAAMRAALRRLAAGARAEALPGPRLADDRLRQIRLAVEAAVKGSPPPSN